MLSCRAAPMDQVLGTYRMDYDYADIIETGAGQGNGHYEYLQVCGFRGIPPHADVFAGAPGLAVCWRASSRLLIREHQPLSLGSF